MAQEFAKAFYSSTAWKNARRAYAKSVGGCCERCERMGMYGVPGDIVHHKIRITAENVNNPAITLNFKNLELLCRDCHAAEHEHDVYSRQRHAKRYTTDEQGRVIAMNDTPLV